MNVLLTLLVFTVHTIHIMIQNVTIIHHAHVCLSSSS